MKEAALADGRTLRIDVLECPLASEDQRTLMSLWRTEWRKTDYDWIQSMNGDYADSLSIASVVGRVDGVAAGTASVCYPRIDAEVAVVGSVLTHPEFRRLGVAQHLTRAVTHRAFAAGCSVSYLGATPMPQSVYLRCGYRWHNGGVMRHAAPEAENVEATWYAGGQNTTIRPAVWGDLSGFACLVVQPLSTWVLDYLRGYLSGRYVALMRCVSNFPNLYYDVAAHGGVVHVLRGDRAHRILGFGSLTPGPAPARNHVGIVDVCAHDRYLECLEAMLSGLLREAERTGVHAVRAYAARPDQGKRDLFLESGFRSVSELPGELCAESRGIDVDVLELS